MEKKVIQGTTAQRERQQNQQPAQPRRAKYPSKEKAVTPKTVRSILNFYRP